MKTLFHLATDVNGKGKDAVFVDGNGRKYTVPFDDPTEIESSWMADKIIEHVHYFGIVEVHSTRTRTGIVYDMDDARERAKESLEVSEKACINDYIMTQLEDRVRQNFPPLPPQGRALECCIKHKYNLLKSGIRCIGWEPPYEMQDPGPGANNAMTAASNAGIQEQINALQARLLEQNQMIIQLLSARASGAAVTGGLRRKEAAGVTTGAAAAEPTSPSAPEPAPNAVTL